MGGILLKDYTLLKGEETRIAEDVIQMMESHTDPLQLKRHAIECAHKRLLVE